MAAYDDSMYDTNDPCDFSMERRLWNIFTGAELVTCAEFLACQDPLTKHFICDSSSVADSSITSYPINGESNIDRISRINRDPPQTQKPGCSRKNPLDPPQSSTSVITNDVLPKELIYYTSPVATINNGVSFERKATEWWNIPNKKATLNAMAGNISLVDQYQEHDKSVKNFPELIDLTTYDIEDEIYIGMSSTKALSSVSNVSQSRDLMTNEALDLETLPTQVSEKRDNSDSFRLEQSNKGSEPPASRSLRQSALEPPGSIHPSLSILIPGGANSFALRLAATKSHLAGTSCENTIDLSYISTTGSNLSLTGTRLSTVRGDVFSIPEEEPCIENVNNEQSALFTIPATESGTQPTIPTFAHDPTTANLISESTTSQECETASPQLPAPPSKRYLNEPIPIHQKPPKLPQYRRFDDSVSGQAQAGVPYGISDAATTNSSCVSTITTEGDNDDDYDDVDSKCACRNGEHGKPIRMSGSNDSIGSLAQNVGIIFVSNDFPVADVTRKI